MSDINYVYSCTKCKNDHHEPVSKGPHNRRCTKCGSIEGAVRWRCPAPKLVKYADVPPIRVPYGRGVYLGYHAFGKQNVRRLVVADSSREARDAFLEVLKKERIVKPHSELDDVTIRVQKVNG